MQKYACLRANFAQKVPENKVGCCRSCKKAIIILVSRRMSAKN